MIRPPYLGNYKFEDTGERLTFSSWFSAWSGLKKLYMPDSLLFVFVFFGLYLAGLLLEYVKALKTANSRFIMRLNLFLLLWFMALAQFIIPVLGDGEVDLPKHLFPYNLCFDLLFVSAVMWVVSCAARAVKATARAVKKAGSLLLNGRMIGQVNGRMNGQEAAGAAVRTTVWAAVLLSLAGMVAIAAFVYTYLYTGGNIPAPAAERARYEGDSGSDAAYNRVITLQSEAGPETVPETKPESMPEAAPETRTAETVKIGDFVRLGRYDGKDIIWQAVYKDDGDVTVISDEIVCSRPFDVADEVDNVSDEGDNTSTETINIDRQIYGSNNWGASDLRKWLNNDFLQGFTAEEQSLIKTTSYKSILSTFDKDLSEEGITYYVWVNSVPLLLQNYHNSFSRTLEDKVFIPGVRELKEYIYDNGLNVRREKDGVYESYWLRTPYASRASFVRCVGKDGYVYHKDACCEYIGVLPMLVIEGGSRIEKGNGSKVDPYMLSGISR
jgi:hypothetical protein